MTLKRVVLLMCGAAMCCAAAVPTRPPFLSITVFKTSAYLSLQFTGASSDDWSPVLLRMTDCLEPKPQGHNTSYGGSQFSVSCTAYRRFSSRGKSLAVDFGPLREAMQREGVADIQIAITAPEGSVDLRGLHLRESSYSGSVTGYGAFQTEGLPSTLVFKLERSPSRAPVFLGLSVTILLGSLLLSCYFSWYAAKSASSPEERWFRLFVWTSNRGLGVWIWLWLLFCVCEGSDLLMDLLGLTSTAQRLLLIGGCFAIVVIVQILCAAVEAPRYSDVRKLDLRRSDVLRVEILKQGAIAITGLLLWYLFQFGLTHLVILLAVPVILFVILRAMLRTIGIKPAALSKGELRDAVMGLAARAGVVCNNLYLLPDNKWKMVNAFASSGRNVTLSQPLVEALTRREVNAMTAHELTHLQENHIQKIKTGTMFVCIPAVMVVSTVIVLTNALPLFTIAPLLLLIYRYVTPVIRRRYEWRADAGAAVISGDPEAVITGLVRITRLNVLPLTFASPWKWTLSHPSTFDRVRAVARKAGIPEARFRELIAPDATQTSDRYSVPSAKSFEAQVFSTERRTSAGLAMLLFLVLLFTLAPAGLVAIAQLRESFYERLGIYVAGAAIAAAIEWYGLNWLGSRSNRTMGRLLREKLEHEGCKVPNSAVLVGLSPSSTPRVYESRYEWDIGFLWFETGRLTYRGEEGSFRIAPANVTGVEMGPPVSNKSQSVTLWLRDPDSRDERVVSIRRIGLLTYGSVRRQTADLYRRVREWRDHAAPYEGPLDMAIPAESQVTSSPSRTMARSIARAYAAPALFAFVIFQLTGMSSETFGFLARVGALSILLTFITFTRILPAFRRDAAPARKRAAAATETGNASGA